MKISAIRSLDNKTTKPFFKAGVTNFYSDFDGTFMPHKYRHDVFCNNSPNSPRKEFLKSGRKEFQDYFDSFGELLDKLRGTKDKKLNFTITSGRNRPEYNYYLGRIREDGLRVPIPDQLIIRNGGEIYTKRKDVEDFFDSKVTEMFLKSDFSQEKRDAVKKATNGWDGDKIREIIVNKLKTFAVISEEDKIAEATRLWPIIAPTVEKKDANILNVIFEEYEKLLFSDMKEVEIVSHIKNLAKEYKEKEIAGLDEARAKETIKAIDKEIEDIAYRIAKARKNACTIFEADTDGAFYGEGMHFNSKRQMMSPVPENWVAFKDNGNLEFHVNLPEHLSRDMTVDLLKRDISQELVQGGIKHEVKGHVKIGENRFSDIIVKPAVGGKRINKLFDTKAQVEKIMAGKLNDLVITAGDDKNDIRMLDLFEYIEIDRTKRRITEENLRKIYDLPLISIYVDNSASKTKRGSLVAEITGNRIEDLEKYFNSDGNVRFIHVIPNNTVGKPQSLQEALEIAVREYAKRNPEFEKNLTPQMQELVRKTGKDYPIDKTFTEELEQTLGAKLWNPVKFKEIVEQIDSRPIVQPIKKGFKKSYLVIAALAMAAVAGVACLLKGKKEKSADNKNMQQGGNK